MEQLIGVVNELHDAFANVKMNIKLNLPQIAVVGSQSSGKSSVLEAIVGKDFLPRGSGIVTRCPLVLQLVQLPKTNDEEWGEFLHKPDKKFFDFKEIDDEIQKRTVEVAGASSITDRPINLKVYSRHVLNLTLVDLPGLVMNAVGDQPKDIDRQIKDMVTKYVSPANTIILAVSPANTDLATSASLRLAKQLDPEGMRTVAVLTKLDLMDRGTDAMDILTGKLMHLRHGFVGVVNRSQCDINEAKGMEAAREDERAFFHSHPAYSAIADKHGTEYLAKKLNHLLLEHIKAVIPDLKVHVDKLLENARSEVDKYGLFEQENIDASAHLLSLIKLFSDTLNHTIDGGATGATKELLGGARLDYIFHECFSSYVNGLTATKVLTDEYIRINNRNMAGMRAALFPSDQVFVALSKEQVGRLEEPSLKCVAFVFEELIKIVNTCASRLDRFPKLKCAVVDICQALLQAYRIPTAAHVRTLLAAERGFINLKHPVMEDLVRDALAMIFGDEDEEGRRVAAARNGCSPEARKRRATNGAPKSTENPAMENVPSALVLDGQMGVYEQSINETIREVVEGYFAVVKTSVCDQVPKAITLLMITKLREEVYVKLVQKLYAGQSAESLLAESPQLEAQRRAASAMMTALKRAQSVLESVRDYAVLD